MNQIIPTSSSKKKILAPVEAMIRQFEGGPVTPIIADDIFGNKVEINEYQGIKHAWYFATSKMVKI